MKTKLLTSIIFMIVTIFYSCSKESDDNTTGNNMQDNNATLTTAQRRFIVSNCSGHGGCHGGAKVYTVGSVSEVNAVLRSAVNPNHNLNICERSKLQGWVNGEVKQ